MISILGNQIVTESFQGSEIEEVALENSQKYERDNGMYVAIQESYSDIVGIYEAIAVTDMCELKQRQADGTLMESTIVMEGFKERVKSIWEKIKAWVQKLWVKLKTFFKNLYTVVSSLFMSGKQFVEKNKKALSTVSSKKVTLNNTFKYEVKTLNATIGDNDSENHEKALSSILDEAKALVDAQGNLTDENKLQELKDKLKEVKDGKDDTVAAARGKFAGQGNKKLTTEEYLDALDVYFQGGNRVAGDATYTVQEAMDLLLADHKKFVDTAQKKVESGLKKANSINDKFKNNAEKISNSAVVSVAVEAINAYISVTNSTNSVIATYISKWRKAVGAANANAKKVCVRAMVGKVDK